MLGRKEGTGGRSCQLPAAMPQFQWFQMLLESQQEVWSRKNERERERERGGGSILSMLSCFFVSVFVLFVCVLFHYWRYNGNKFSKQIGCDSCTLDYVPWSTSCQLSICIIW